MNCPVGKNTLTEKMKKLSNKAGLSRVHTINCLRASSITFLDISGIQAKDICSVSRHRSTDGILPYTSGPTDKKRYEMSSILHDQSSYILYVISKIQFSYELTWSLKQWGFDYSNIVICCIHPCTLLSHTAFICVYSSQHTFVGTKTYTLVIGKTCRVIV